MAGCENVATLVDAFFQSDDQIAIVLEYLDADVTPDHIPQLVAGLAQIHSKGILYRDLNLNNVKLDAQGTVKFFDFGISKKFREGIANTKNCVTRCYRPPEIFFGDQKYTQKADIWSLGCLIYELHTKKHLFGGTGDLEVVCKIFEVLGSPKDWPECEDMPCYLPMGEAEGAEMLPEI